MTISNDKYVSISGKIMTRDGAREDILKKIRQELTRISSMASDAKNNSNLSSKDRDGLNKAESLIDNARQILFNIE